MEAARFKIASKQARRLSEFAALNRAEFGLLLDCVGAALALQGPGINHIKTTSRDGSLAVRLERIEDGRQARIETEDGTLLGPDYWITITESE